MARGWGVGSGHGHSHGRCRGHFVPQESRPGTLPRDETTASEVVLEDEEQDGPKVVSRACTPEKLFFYVFQFLWGKLRCPYIVCRLQDLGTKSAHTGGGMTDQAGVSTLASE